MLQDRHNPQGAVRRFFGPKVKGTIPVLVELVHDALVQASLDPAVSSMEHLGTANVRGEEVPLDAIVASKDGRRVALDVIEVRPLRSIDDEGTFLLTLESLGIEVVQISASDIRQEPRFSNCRMVWSHRVHHVPLTVRMQVFQMLSDEGPLRLAHLLKGIRCDRDPTPAIMSMACDDVIEVELGEFPLGLETVVRMRRSNR